MSSQSNLQLDWCTHEAAKYAVTHWHYSKSLPPPPMVHVGVWEFSKFVGCVLFARGASAALLSPYNIGQTEGCELVRIALGKHITPVSKIVRIALLMLKRSAPRLRLVVSFADPFNGHHGGIYQAGGWIYAGKTSPTSMYLDSKGKMWHARMISSTGTKKVFGKYKRVLRPSECREIRMPGKHRYLMALDDDMKRFIMPLAKPYPKRAGSADSGTTDSQSVRGGATPTSALSESLSDNERLQPTGKKAVRT